MLTGKMKCSIGNLPSSALTPIFEDIFLAPKVNLQKIKSILSQGVLVKNITLDQNIFDKTSNCKYLKEVKSLKPFII
jgi:hypothetical protein